MQKKSRNVNEEAAKILLECQGDSVKFVRKILKVEPDDWQIEALRAMDSGMHVVIKSGHGVGKTALLSWITLQTLACFPYSKVPCTAPTSHQLRNLLWAEIGTWLNKSILKGMLKWTATSVCVNGFEESWRASAVSCRKPENLAGFHAPKIRYIVDEASGVDDPLFEVVDGALTTEGGQLIMTGNPTRLDGYFYKTFQKPMEGVHLITASSLDSKRVSKSWAKMMADKWGESSDIYRVRVLGEFPKLGTDSFITLDLVEYAVTNENVLAEGDVYIGVDVSKGIGRDESVICTRKGNWVYPLQASRTWTIPELANRVILEAKKYNAKAIMIDDTGLSGATDLIKEGLRGTTTQVCPINFGGSGNDNYLYLSGVMWDNVRNMLRDRMIKLPMDDEMLVGQLSTRGYTINPKGKIVLERKEDLNDSPDRADALVLCFFTGLTPKPAGVILEASDDVWDGGYINQAEAVNNLWGG